VADPRTIESIAQDTSHNPEVRLVGQASYEAPVWRPARDTASRRKVPASPYQATVLPGKSEELEDLLIGALVERPRTRDEAFERVRAQTGLSSGALENAWRCLVQAGRIRRIPRVQRKLAEPGTDDPVAVCTVRVLRRIHWTSKAGFFTADRDGVRVQCRASVRVGRILAHLEVGTMLEVQFSTKRSRKRYLEITRILSIEPYSGQAM
jgi:hypothetical protein